MNWTEEQLEIFEAFADSSKEHLAIEARAGSGKTTTALEGVRRARLRPNGTALMAAFNKRIASELQDKTEWPIVAKTLHSLGYGYLRKKNSKLRVDGRRGYVNVKKVQERLAKANAAAVYEGRMTKNVYAIRDRELTKLVKDLTSAAKQVVPFAKSGEELVDLATAFALVPDERLVEKGLKTEHVCEIAFGAMEEALENDGTVDFDDMLWLPLKLRLVFPAFCFIVIDETQDLSPVQVEILERALEKGGRYAFVGDPRQTVYQFRGADEELFGRLIERYGCTHLTLTTSFRCPQKVIAEARKTVSDIRCLEDAPEGKVTVIYESSLGEQAKPGDFVLARGNADLVPFWEELVKRGTPAYILGKGEAGALLGLISKIAKRGHRRIESFAIALGQYADEERLLAEEDPTRSEFYARLREQVSMLSTLMTACQAKELEDLRQAVGEAFPDEDGIDPFKVVLSTVHKVKGLEAERVFLYKKGLGEDSNLRYVGVTRARRELVWVYPMD